MTDSPCTLCSEDCMGGIIYGNCQQFRRWCRSHNYLNISFGSTLPGQTECETLSGH